MRSRLAIGALVVGAGLGVAVDRSPRAIPLLLAAVAVFFWLERLDNWRKLFAITIALLVVASMNDTVHPVLFYGRYAAAAALVLYTCRRHPLEVPVALMPRGSQRLVNCLRVITIVAVFSILWSVVPATTAQQSIALALLVALVMVLLTRRWRDPTRIGPDLGVAFTILVVSFAAGMAADYAGIGGTRSFFGRFQGLYANPNTLGMSAAIATMLGVGLWSAYRRLWYLGGTIVAATSLLLCASRTAIAATVVAVAWIVLRAGAGRTIRAAAATLVIVLALVMVGGPNNPVSRTTQSFLDRWGKQETGEQQTGERDLAWREGGRLWRLAPLQGHGFRSTEVVFEQQYQERVVQFDASAAHNGYIQTLIELGLLGMAPLLVLLSVVQRMVRRARPHGLATGLVGATVAGFVIQIGESSLFGTGQVFAWVFWLAVAGLAMVSEVAPTGASQVGAIGHSFRARVASA